MSMQHIRDHYGVPAKRGARITYTGEPQPRQGVIVGSLYHWIRVRFDGEKVINSLHPTWEVTYHEETR